MVEEVRMNEKTLGEQRKKLQVHQTNKKSAFNSFELHCSVLLKGLGLILIELSLNPSM